MMSAGRILLPFLLSVSLWSDVVAFAGNIAFRCATGRQQGEQYQHRQQPQLQRQQRCRQPHPPSTTLAVAYHSKNYATLALRASGTAIEFRQSHNEARTSPIPTSPHTRRVTRLKAASPEGGDINAAAAAPAAPAGEQVADEASAGAEMGVAGVDLVKGIAFEAPKAKEEELKEEEASKKVQMNLPSPVF